MLRIFGHPDRAKEAGLPSAKYTRFQSPDTLAGEDERLTRFDTVPPEAGNQPASIDRIVPKRPERTTVSELQNRESKPRAPKFNDAAHLHADDAIPVSVLKKALPLRFVQTREACEEFALS